MISKHRELMLIWIQWDCGMKEDPSPNLKPRSYLLLITIYKWKLNFLKMILTDDSNPSLGQVSCLSADVQQITNSIVILEIFFSKCFFRTVFFLIGPLFIYYVLWFCIIMGFLYKQNVCFYVYMCFLFFFLGFFSSDGLPCPILVYLFLFYLYY